MIWRQYTREGAKRGIDWNLSREDFESLLPLPCFYCERIPCRKFSGRFFQLGGIDRFNNDIGYQKNNCVPCCRPCNMAKKSGTVSDFRDWVIKLSKNMKAIALLLDVDESRN